MTPKPDWQELLRAAHNDPIDPAHYTAVRARVLAEIEQTRSPWRRLAWLSGVGAVAAALTLVVPFPRPTLPPLPPLATPGVAGNLVAGARPQVPHVARAQRVAKPHHEPITVKFQTSDPNIVIYWIAD